jgi:hypothetical protein
VRAPNIAVYRWPIVNTNANGERRVTSAYPLVIPMGQGRQHHFGASERAGGIALVCISGHVGNQDNREGTM